MSGDAETAVADSATNVRTVVHVAEDDGNDRVGSEEPLSLFDEPVYIQRYLHADEAIRLFNATHDENHQVRVVADIGCAELRYASRYRFSRLASQVICLDMDKMLLNSYTYRVEPQLFELISPRELPLQFCVYAGSACQYDKRLYAVDAVIMLEFIEHVDICEHEYIVRTVFDYMQPNLIFVTTPNAEFNVVFPDGDVNKRRHYDHRFEWTRSEFEQWCLAITAKFAEYTVAFSGIAAGPPGTEQYGCCSQAATFVRSVNIPRRPVPSAVSDATPYELLLKIDMPFRPPKTPFELNCDACRSAVEIIAGERYRSSEYIRNDKNYELSEPEGIIEKFKLLIEPGDLGKFETTLVPFEKGPIKLGATPAGVRFDGYTVIKLQEICDWLAPKRDCDENNKADEQWSSTASSDPVEVGRALAKLSESSPYWFYDSKSESFTVKFPAEDDSCDDYVDEYEDKYKDEIEKVDMYPEHPVIIEELKDEWDDEDDEEGNAAAAGQMRLVNKVHDFD